MRRLLHLGKIHSPTKIKYNEQKKILLCIKVILNAFTHVILLWIIFLIILLIY